MTLALSLLLGALMGLTIGALGGGGSILTVPALVFGLGLTAQEATTGSLVIVGVTAGIASIGYARDGNARWGRALVLVLAGVPASVAGSQLNRLVDPNVLLLAFAGLMVVAAVGMLVRSGRPEETPGPAAGPERPQTGPSLAALSLRLLPAGLGIGFLTGFLGVGGGFVIVPALVLLLQYEMPVAVGTSLVVIALNSAVALGARAGSGHFVWPVLLPFTAAAVLTSLAGQRLGDRVDPDRLTQAFAVLLLLVAAYVVGRHLVVA